MNEDAVSLWIRRAESDLKIAKGELAKEAPATDAICFHMQQCAGKYLKAFLIFHGQEVPRTHDIAFLIMIMRCAQIAPEFQQLVGWGVPSLTTYAVEVRYDTLLFPSIAEPGHAVALAEQGRNFVRAKLSEKGYGGNF
jgi:HEPN domain-containing protein